MDQTIIDLESMLNDMANDMAKDVLENPVFQLYFAHILVQKGVKLAKEFEYVPPIND